MFTFQQLPKKYKCKSRFVPLHVTKATKGRREEKKQLHSFLHSARDI